MLHRPPKGRRTSRRGPIPSTLAPRSDTLRRKRAAAEEQDGAEVVKTPAYHASPWFEHSNAYAFFDEGTGEATAEHAAGPELWSDPDEDADEDDDPWDDLGHGAWAAAEFAVDEGTRDGRAVPPPGPFQAREPDATEAPPALDEGSANPSPVHDDPALTDDPQMPGNASSKHEAGPEAAARAGEASPKFHFLAAATRYSLDYPTPDEVADEPPASPGDADLDARAAASDAVDDGPDALLADVVDDEEPSGTPEAARPSTHHGGRGPKPRKVHARRRSSRAPARRRAVIAALLVTGGIAGTALAVSGPGGSERVAARATTTAAPRDDLLTTPSTSLALADLPDPGVTETTLPVTAPTTVASATTSTTRTPRPAAATTLPKPTMTTTVVTAATMPPFTTTTLVTTTTTRAPTTTTTAVTTTTVAPTTTTTSTTTTQPPTTTTTTTAAP